jgi:hypothetical protein
MDSGLLQLLVSVSWALFGLVLFSVAVFCY